MMGRKYEVFRESEAQQWQVRVSSEAFCGPSLACACRTRRPARMGIADRVSCPVFQARMRETALARARIIQSIDDEFAQSLFESDTHKYADFLTTRKMDLSIGPNPFVCPLARCGIPCPDVA
eukprot:1194451-Rhodomonas_salina.2